ncbi:Putative hydroxypyruvate reductase [Pirellula sp. SH-Sr6A]|uniref:glycerate kinase type-2 family protein n=1 Tax=Pirellula sp. SH-Sr6A TaxID=1632865 RepID=UPI00078D8318|nr:DUF4147 domain-containing protein [Pirellula sp. SH-Sr6A]AMV33874.1 Putative hydroxypyruvate reductase [Pirellula sp. SH-Sr6A]
MTIKPRTLQAINIWNAGVESVRGDRLIERSIRFDREQLLIEDIGRYSLRGIDRILVLGGGKAAAAMAAGLESIWNSSNPPRQRLEGWLHAPRGSFDESPMAVAHRRIALHAARPAGINEPTREGMLGCEQMLRLARSANEKTLVLCLLSGGASALMPSPLPGLLLEDKVALTRHLSRNGAKIEELNEVRRALSQIKGGGLARACSRAQRVVSLVLSDVLGDPLHLIGSGPTILEPPPNPKLALEIIARFDPHRELPPSIRRCLETRSKSPDESLGSKGCPVETHVLANNATAVDAAGTQAVALGYAYWMESNRASEGDVRGVAEKLLRAMELAVETGQPDCLISGGEPTVQLPRIELCGRGGRNQQLALTLLHLLENHSHPKLREARCVSIVCAGTDGEDGPTQAAGAFVDHQVVEAARKQGLESEDYLARCDAYSFFEKADGLLVTGPTNTNVCDLRVILIRD